MATTSDDFRRQVNELWKQALDQLEEVKDAIVRSTGRFEVEAQRLRQERDRLLRRLGEQTHKLAQEGKLPMPAFVKSTVDRLNEVLDHLVAKEGAGAEESEAADPRTSGPKRPRTPAARKPRRKTGTRRRPRPKGETS